MRVVSPVQASGTALRKEGGSFLQRLEVGGGRAHWADHHGQPTGRWAPDEDMPPEATQVTHKHVYYGPITRSRAKLLQKEVTSFLAETNFNIHENIILPKNSTLILLRCSHEEKDQIGQPDRTARSDQVRSDNQIGPPDRTTSSDHQKKHP